MWTKRFAALAVAVIMGAGAAQALETSVDASSLPDKKQTKAGLYLTATDAFKAIEADPSIVFIDVRSRPEFNFVGYPMVVDSNIPHRVLTGDWNIDAKRKQYAMEPNIDFPAAVEALLAREGKGKDDPIIVICRSGTRSSGAANYLTDLGYTNVWSVVDGVEGDKDDNGHRTVNGWKNSGLPYTYKLNDTQAYNSPSF